jgi:hypothetical protein
MMREYIRPTRRTLLASGIGAAVMTCLIPSPGLTLHPEIARGRVIHKRWGSLEGIPGVLVSNGVEVTRTDHDGAYAIPARDGVFVIKPAHWSPPRNLLTGLPHFSYNHKPNGSPAGLRYKGCPPTGPLPPSIDFILERSPESRAFNALLFADPQPADAGEVGFVRTTVDKIACRRDFAFGLALGDIAGDNLGIYESYLEQTARLGAPVWHLPGNHDHDADAASPHHRLDTWRATFGPPTFAFEHADALFIMLDNVQPLPGAYEGRIGQAGLTFVRNLLSFTPQNKLIVICTHIPLTSSHSQDPSCNTLDADLLLQLLHGRKAVSFSGHMHTSEHHYLGSRGEQHHHQIIAAMSGSWWSGPFDALGRPLAIASDGTPHGWHVLSIDGDEHQTDFISARDDAIGRVIFNETFKVERPALALETVAGAPNRFSLMVNVFDGGPRTRVFVEQDGANLPLTRISETDPHTKQVYESAGDTLKHWVRAEPSTHLWALEPKYRGKLDPSRARLTIIDEFSRRRVSNALLCNA